MRIAHPQVRETVDYEMNAMSPALPVSVPGPGARVPVALRVHRAEHRGLHVGDDVGPRVRPVVRHHVAHVAAAHAQHVARHREHGGVRHEAGRAQPAAVHEDVQLLVLGGGLSQTCKRCLTDNAATRPVGSDKYLVFNLQQLLSQSAHVQ